MALGDATLVLGHRMSEWLSRAPTLEEDIAMANLSLDLIGQTRAFYARACELEGGGRDETALAFRRAEQDYRNPLIVEQPNGNFADTMARHLLFSAYAAPLYEKLAGSNDAETAGIAQRSSREMAYHLRHAAEWMIRLGDGTSESHMKAQAALDDLWPYGAGTVRGRRSRPPEGLPLAYEVLPGNTADNATLRGFLEKIEAQYGKAQRIWVMDRGIPTEEVLREMRQADPPISYLVGTPKGRLTKMEKALLARIRKAGLRRPPGGG